MKQSCTVLLVDDDVLVARAIMAVLRAKGHHVSVAGDGLRAIETLATGLEPNLVIVDLLMPNMDGFAFLARLSSQSPHLPVVVLTALPRDEVVHRMAELHLPRQPIIMFKPIRSDGLLRLIDTTVASSS